MDPWRWGRVMAGMNRGGVLRLSAYIDGKALWRDVVVAVEAGRPAHRARIRADGGGCYPRRGACPASPGGAQRLNFADSVGTGRAMPIQSYPGGCVDKAVQHQGGARRVFEKRDVELAARVVARARM